MRTAPITPTLIAPMRRALQTSIQSAIFPGTQRFEDPDGSDG